MKFVLSWRRGTRAAAYGAVAAATATTGLFAVAAPAAHAAVAPGKVISSAGPLKTIGISPDLNCYVRRTDDTDGEWYNGRDTSDPTAPGDTACGTFLVVNGQLYGPAQVPAGSSATNAETGGWTPVSQTGPTGTGTAANPYTITTVVRAGATGVTLTETDSYVVGQEGYSTYISTSNPSAAPANFVVYHAGDCFLQNSDLGYGVVDTADGAAGCQAPVDPTASTLVRGTRVEQLFPLTSGSSYQEANYDAVWSTIGSKAPFANTCDCADAQYEDNGVGVSWALNGVAAGAAIQEGVYTSMSPNGTVPATTGNTADAPTVLAGGQSGYTVTVHNTGASTIHLVAVTDTLPAGFSYVQGSTTGLVTTNPTISGQTLTWSVPSTPIPAAGSATLHFGFLASTVPGDYTNSASGVATETAVVPAGQFAPLHVITVPSAPSSLVTAGSRHTVTLTWGAPASNGNSVVTGYDVQVTPAGSAPSVRSFDASTSTRAITGLADNKAYTFWVRAKNAAGAGAWTAPVTVSGTALANAKVSTLLTYGGKRVLGVTVKSGATALGGVRLTLLGRVASKHAWSVVGHVITKANGTAKFTVKPSRNMVYEWQFAGDAGHTGSAVDRALKVAPSISISAHSTVAKGSVSVLGGKVKPLFAKQKVVLQRKVGKRWVTVTSATISKSGSYAFALNTSTKGTTVYRVVKAAWHDWVTGYSATKSVTVK